MTTKSKEPTDEINIVISSNYYTSRNFAELDI